MPGKRILIVANSDLSFDQRLLRISRSLFRHGYSPELWGRTFPKSVKTGNEDFPQHRLMLWFQKGKLGYLELNLRFFLRLVHCKADAVCSVDLDTLPACWLVSRWKNIPLIHDAHEYMAEVPEVYQRPLTRSLWHQVAHALLPQVRLAYTVSQSLVEEFRKVYRKEFGLVRNMPEKRDFPESGEEPLPSGHWVFLGAVNQGRGLEEFIPLLKSDPRDVWILGDGDRMDAVKELVRKQGLETRVKMPGKLPPEQAAGILKNAWAGINLLTDEGLSYRYSLANKFFDYVHAGIPQICIGFPEYQKLMAEYRVGILCSMEAAGIRHAMEEISKPDQQESIRKEARLAREVWNWQQEEKQLIRLYDQLFRFHRPDPETTS